MTLGTGASSLAGAGLESLAGTYGTLVVPTVLLPFVSENINNAEAWQEHEMLIGKVERTYPILTGNQVTGSFRIKGGYRTPEYLVFAALGGTDTKTGASSPYTHTMEPGETIDRAFSLIIDKVVNCWNIAGGKVSKWTIDSSPDGVFFDFDILGKVLTEATTHRAALAALTFTEHVVMCHHQLVMRIADCTDALAAGDAIDVSKVTLEVDNTLDSNGQTTTSGLYHAEPERAGFRKVGLKFTLPRYQVDTLRTAFLAGTKLQADLIWTGPAVGGGTYKFQVNLPTVYIKSCDAPIGGPDNIPVDVTAECYRNNSNANMTETEAIQVIMINANATALTWTA